MVDEKHLAPEVADRIGYYVKFAGGPELVDTLLADAALAANKNVSAGLEAMRAFLGYCQLYGVGDRVRFDMSLARGLDYYTASSMRRSWTVGMWAVSPAVVGMTVWSVCSIPRAARCPVWASVSALRGCLR